MDFAAIYNEHASAIIKWIHATLNSHSAKRTAVSASGHTRLFDYFPAAFLDKKYVMPVDKVPVVPLDFLGVPEFNSMNQLSVIGITYLDSFFIQEDEKDNAALHFHELIHTIQWEYLGMEKFLLCYGYGLLTSGYRNSPLEVMAYDLEKRFNSGEVFDAIPLVYEQMKPIEVLAGELLRMR
jgi:hypothetical protein